MSSVRFGVSAVLLCGIVIFLARIHVTDLMGRVGILAAQQELISEQLIELQQFRGVLLDLETGQRGFLLTGNETYLDSYPANRRKLASTVSRVEMLSQADRNIQTQVNELAALSHAKEREVADSIRLRRDGGLAAAVAVVQTDMGKRTMDEFNSKMTSLIVRLNQQRSAVANDGLSKYRELLFVGRCVIALILLLVIVAIGFLTLSIRRLDEIHRQREREAMHDPLTGLPNRRYLHEWLEFKLAAAARSKQQLALLYFDLDGFKAVNDDFGHATGDHLLQTIGARLRDTVRASDFVARLGGDEFVIVLADTSMPSTVSALIARLRENLAKATIPEFTNRTVAASIGVATYPDDGANATELLSVADREMYHAKESRRAERLGAAIGIRAAA